MASVDLCTSPICGSIHKAAPFSQKNLHNLQLFSMHSPMFWVCFREIQSSKRGCMAQARCWQQVFSRQCATLSGDNDAGHRRERPPGARRTGSAETMSSFLEGEAPAPSLNLQEGQPDAARKSTENASYTRLNSMALYGRIYKKFGGQWSDQDQTQLVARIWGAEGQ